MSCIWIIGPKNRSRNLNSQTKTILVGQCWTKWLLNLLSHLDRVTPGFRVPFLYAITENLKYPKDSRVVSSCRGLHLNSWPKKADRFTFRTVWYKVTLKSAPSPRQSGPKVPFYTHPRGKWKSFEMWKYCPSMNPHI